MRCFICNAALTPEEVHYNKKYEDEKYGPYDPCRKCILEIEDVFQDHVEEDDDDVDVDAALAEEELYL